MVSAKVLRTVQRMLKPGEELLYVGYNSEVFSLRDALLKLLLRWMELFLIFGVIGLMFIPFVIMCILFIPILAIAPSNPHLARVLLDLPLPLTGLGLGCAVVFVAWKQYRGGLRPWFAMTDCRLIVWVEESFKTQVCANSESSLEVVGDVRQDQGDIHYFGSRTIEGWRRDEHGAFRPYTDQQSWNYVLRGVPFPHEVISKARKSDRNLVTS